MLFRSILLLLSFSAAAFAQPGGEPRLQLTAQEKEEFVGLLNALPEDSIRTALSTHLDQYKNGIFDHDRKAIEKVHDEDPPLATKLLSVAALEALKVDLAKRQSPSNTSSVPSSTEVPSSSAPPPPSSTSSPPLPPPTSEPPTSEPPTSEPPPPPSSTSDLPSVEFPTTYTTTDSAGSSVEVASTFYATPTASAVIPIITTDDQGSAYTTSTYLPGVVITHTDTAGSQVVVTTPVPNTRRTTTKTDSHGSTFVTDYIPGDVGASSKVVFVTTLPDGEVKTITTYEIVGATPTGDGGNGGPDATRTRPPPGVQTAAGNVVSYPWLAEAVALVACAAVFTFFL